MNISNQIRLYHIWNSIAIAHRRLLIFGFLCIFLFIGIILVLVSLIDEYAREKNRQKKKTEIIETLILTFVSIVGFIGLSSSHIYSKIPYYAQASHNNIKILKTRKYMPKIYKHLKKFHRHQMDKYYKQLFKYNNKLNKLDNKRDYNNSMYEQIMNGNNNNLEAQDKASKYKKSYQKVNRQIKTVKEEKIRKPKRLYCYKRTLVRYNKHNHLKKIPNPTKVQSILKF